MSWPPWLGSGLALHPVAEMSVLITLEKTNNPNPFPIGNKFGLYWFGKQKQYRCRRSCTYSIYTVLITWNIATL